MCNYAAVKRWKRSVAWFLSFGAKSVADAERNFSRKCFYVATYLRILSCYVNLTRVLAKRQLESHQRHLEKTAAVKAEANVVSIGRKTTVYRLEAGESRFLETRTMMSIATRSRISLTCL